MQTKLNTTFSNIVIVPSLHFSPHAHGLDRVGLKPHLNLPVNMFQVFTVREFCGENSGEFWFYILYPRSSERR